MAGEFLTSGLKRAQHAVQFQGAKSAQADRVRAATICLPWNRPFSIKISLVWFPPITTPATKMPGTLLSWVCGSMEGLLVSGSSEMPMRAQKLEIRMVSGQCKNLVSGQVISPA